MSLARFAKKRDAAEPEIVQALERVGATVCKLDRPVDLLVNYRKRWFLLEVKSPKAHKDKRQLIQQQFITAMDVPVVRTADEALKAVGAML